MQIQYDPVVDVLVIRLREGEYSESDEFAPGMIVDVAADGTPLAIEILNAQRILNPSGESKLELPFLLSVG